MKKLQENHFKEVLWISYFSSYFTDKQTSSFQANFSNIEGRKFEIQGEPMPSLPEENVNHRFKPEPLSLNWNYDPSGISDLSKKLIIKCNLKTALFIVKKCNTPSNIYQPIF